MAAFSTLKILRLQARRQRPVREVAEAREQLKDLSARLVQAQEPERRALSLELHDEVGQSLSAVLVELGNLSARLEVRSKSNLARMWNIKGLVERTVRMVRNMALLLRPSMLDDLGLVPALRWQAREVSKRTSMDVSVAAEGVRRFAGRVQDLRLPRGPGGVHNCSRHSGATTVRMRVQQEAGRLTLSIQDDGQGFEAGRQRPGPARHRGTGGASGWKFQVHSAPGSGQFTVDCPAHEPPTRPVEVTK